MAQVTGWLQKQTFLRVRKGWLPGIIAHNVMPSQTGIQGKVKVKFSLCFFNWAPRHEGVLGEWRYISTRSSTSALDGGEWLASRPGRFTARPRSSGTHWIRGWVSPRAVLHAVVRRKIPSPLRESNPRNRIVQPVAQRYNDWAITAVRYARVYPKVSGLSRQRNRQ
jgi:hypothetical protein